MSQPVLLEAMSGSFPKPASPQLAHKGLSLITHKLMTIAEVTGINGPKQTLLPVQSQIMHFLNREVANYYSLNYGCTYKLQCVKAQKHYLAQV